MAAGEKPHLSISQRSLLIPEFKESDHSYWVGGKQAPGVTTFLKAVLGGNPFWTAEGREFGNSVHAAIHYHADDDLDFDSVPERVKPRLEAYIKFCADMQWKPDLVEQPLYREMPFYAGTSDQAQDERAVADFKNGPHLPDHALQLALYAFLLPNPLRYERWGVHLQDTGKYTLTAYKRQDLASDYNVGISCLNIYNWRKRHVGSGTQRNAGA